MEAGDAFSLAIAAMTMVVAAYAAWLWGCLLNIAATRKDTRLARRAGLIMLAMAVAFAGNATITIQIWSKLYD